MSSWRPRSRLAAHLLLARPIPPPPLPARRCLRGYSTTPPAAPTTRDSLQDLWSSPSIRLAPLPTLFPPRRRSAPRDLSTSRPRPLFLDQAPSFAYSAVSWRSHQVNYYVPEVCVLGCSNAGKSTFINALLGATGLARSSSRPGSTREMNAYATGPVVKRKVIKNENAKAPPKMDLLRSLILMDTPGYGYNSVKEWGRQIEEYLERRTMLKGVVLLLRADVPLTRWDTEVLEFLAHHQKRTLVIFTRADRCRADGAAWLDACAARCDQVRELVENPKRGKSQGDWVPEMCVTAAGMGDALFAKRAKLKRSPAREEAGMGGARIAVLRLAGLMGKEAKSKEPAPEPWVGKIVSWDDIPMKGG
ncbi:unnamed protein product [Parascedosporium putredinis]|uniref:EngB-type G domain-containing protein n=1 Tax=Parascedosporium putredinis TaxID=1442378 RepID=A0A9P1H7T1_9PEZI|nr:unnamed protein product [Parascedosporium putredinis]CAI7999970.1 unnamed protein product [Parascedosporium putredinis]